MFGGAPQNEGYEHEPGQPDGSAVSDSAERVTADVREAVFAVSVGTIPGTDPQQLAQQMADHVNQLPAAAAALIGMVDVPADVAAAVRSFAGVRDQAEAAAEFLVLVVRLYYERTEALPRDALGIAIATRELWERQLVGPTTGLLSVTVVPGVDPDRWIAAATQTPWIVATAKPSPGLLPGIS